MKNKNYDKVSMTIIENGFGLKKIIDGEVKSEGTILQPCYNHNIAYKADLNDLYRAYVNQKRYHSNIAKSYQFAIQCNTKGVRLKKKDFEGDCEHISQICLIDIDTKPIYCNGTELEGISDRIIERVDEIMADSPFIYLQQSISGGIHVIGFMDKQPKNNEEYKRQSSILTAFFCKRVKDVLKVTLTSVDKVVDTHNLNAYQLLFVSNQPMYINVNFVSKQFTEQDIKALDDEFHIISFAKQEIEREVKQKEYYAQTEVDQTVRYRIAIEKLPDALSFDFGKNNRFALGTSLKTLVGSGSITINKARILFARVASRNKTSDTSYHGQIAEFEDVLSRDNIKPIIAFRLLEKVGIHVTSIYKA